MKSSQDLSCPCFDTLPRGKARRADSWSRLGHLHFLRINTVRIYHIDLSILLKERVFTQAHSELACFFVGWEMFLCGSVEDGDLAFHYQACSQLMTSVTSVCFFLYS